MADEEDPEAKLAAARSTLAPKKVLMVLTSTTTYPDGETPTGFWLTEAFHPYLRWLAAGWTVDFVSTAGTAQADPASVEDATSKNDRAALDAYANIKEASIDTQPVLETLCTEEALPATVEAYDVLFFCGGYGTMWDLPENESVKALTKAMYEANKIVSAVCHGPIAFINVELSDGTKLLAGKEVTAFTNGEEEAMGKTDIVAKPSGPGSCEDAMQWNNEEGAPAGATFKDGGVFAANVVVDGLLFTGQNPPSAAPLAEAVLFRLDPIRAKYDPPRAAMLAEREELVVRP